MTEVWFYHLQTQSFERALPRLVTKGIEDGRRVAIQTVDDLRLKALDDLLWTFAPESFLPHGSVRDPNPEVQPILITTGPDNENAAAIRIYVEGAEIDLDPATAPYDRVILLFDGTNDEEVAAARAQWARLKEKGFTLAYWQQSPAGRWERRSA